MGTRFKDYPVYTYDEPAVYSDFYGGLNTDPSNDHLLDSELRDVTNMTYLSGALVKRKGAHKLCDVSCDDRLSTIQGAFLFTYRITYLILAADGKLYQGVFAEDAPIELKRIYITKPDASSAFAHDETNAFEGLQYRTVDESKEMLKHDGYLQSFYKNAYTGETFQANMRGSYSSVFGLIQKGDTFTETIGVIDHEFVCIREFSKEESSQEDAAKIHDQSYFYDISDPNRSDYSKTTHLIFQNHDKVEAATYDNRLFIATGTRIIEVFLDSDELNARPLPPYICNYTEITNIGYNYLSPYPELAVAGKSDAVYTEMDALKVQKTVAGTYLISAVMHVASNDDVSNYSFRWEKLVDGVWMTIIPYRGQAVLNEDGTYSLSARSGFNMIEVTDADRFRYRCTFASEFRSTVDTAEEWKITESYSVGDLAFFGSKVYKCLVANVPSKTVYPSGSFSTMASIQDSEGQWTEDVNVWEQVYELEVVPFYYKTVSETDGSEEWHKSSISDFVANNITNNANRTATSVLYDPDLKPNDAFKLMHSCRSVLTDGSKLIFYNDAYNSGQWFKTVIGNPHYITQRGSLSFKTTKNEALVKVTPFQGNLIAFANSADSGGSIHMVQGNGDDYDDGSGYYSPYRRSLINDSISCDDPKTVQVCDNYLFFKSFRIVYCINASDLSNEVVRVTQCNAKLLERNDEVRIPWDEPCVSESTDSYYGLIWPKRYESNEDGDLVLSHPGMRLKLYYKTSVQHKDGSYTFPWLKDEGDCFDLNEIVYAKGRPLHLYKNLLIDYEADDYSDLGEQYDCVIRTKGYGLEYPDQYKFVERAIVSFHRDQFNPVDISLEVRNEAGHPLIGGDSKRLSANDFGVLHIGNENDGSTLRLTSTIRDDKVYNSINMFPCLLAEAKITARTKGSFTLASITYHYTSCDNPNTNPYDTYTGIIRPKEVK